MKDMKKTSWIVLIVGIILCMIGIGLICYNLGMNKGSKNDSAGKEAQAAETQVASQTVTEKETVASSESVKESETAKAESSEETAESSEQKEVVLAAKREGDLATPANSGALKVVGTNLCDQNGNPIQLRGISTHGIAWFPSFVDQNAFREFRNDWDVNVMRLAMYTAENQGYCEDGNKEDLKNIIYRGVQYATDNDMYVIIDWHILHDLTPLKYKDEAIDFFDGMSKKYKDNNNVIYEICNEPNGGTSWADIKKYALEVIPVIRANDPDAVIIVGTPNWSQRVDEAAADPITEYDNVMYALHFYAATHKDDLRKTMTDAIKAGLPVFVSEYGICDASGNGGLDKSSAQKWIETMDENNVSYICWALANKSESACLIKSSVSKTSGFTESDLSPQGKWLYQMLTGKEAISGDGEKKEDTGSQPVEDVQEFQSGGLEVTVSLGSQWEEKGVNKYQLNVSLANPSDSKVKNWAIDIHFNGDVKISDSWNAKYTANGNTIHIINGDHNGEIAGGGTLGDLGLIIEGPAGLEITK